MIATIDCQKAFDTVEYFAIWSALRELGVPEQYVQLLEVMY